MNVHILATVRKPELLKFTTMVFSTLRVGFPTASVTVHANRLSNEVDDVLLLASSNVNAKHVRVDTIHHEWITNLLKAEDDPFWIVDTDMVFFERVEGFRFSTALAGWRIPEWNDAFAGAITRARLHTSLLYIDPIKVESETMDYACKIAHTVFTPQANLINPLVIPFKGKSYFYDTCSLLYHAIGGTSFTDEQKSAYCHLNFGTISDLVLPRLPKEEASIMEQARQCVVSNPSWGRDAWRAQELYYANHPA